jgi:branched-chain amino acid transport system substrate-binding protein
MLDAIERAGEDGEVDREEVIQEIFATENYRGVLGTWSFDDDGDTTLTELSVVKVEKGEFVLDRILNVEDML